MSIKVYHGTDIIIKNPKLIKTPEEIFGKELGDGFYVFKEENKNRAIEYAIDTYIYHGMQNDIIINNYEFIMDEFINDAIKEFKDRLIEDEIDLIVSNILRIKIKNCKYINNDSVKCDKCNLECPKNKKVVMTLLIDKFLYDKIIDKNFDSNLTREKLTTIINEKFNSNFDKQIEQLRIAGDIKSYIKFIGYEKIDKNDLRIEKLINERFIHILNN